MIESCAAEDPRITKVLRTLTVQQGPGEILVACKLAVRDDLTSIGVIEAINQFEVRLQTRSPDVKWCFIEPDIVD